MKENNRATRFIEPAWCKINITEKRLKNYKNKTNYSFQSLVRPS
jgi:hypothetical protein